MKLFKVPCAKDFEKYIFLKKLQAFQFFEVRQIASCQSISLSYGLERERESEEDLEPKCEIFGKNNFS